MKDRVFEKQLERFGIEQIRVVQEVPGEKRRQLSLETNTTIIKALMSTIEGREWLYNKLDFYCVNSTPFVAGQPDATAFLCGLQEAGHQLNNEIMLSAPDKYFEMITEAAARKANKAD